MKANDPQRLLIADADALRAFCDALAGIERIGLDTEFIRERTYVPALETIQVAGPDDCALIDCRAVGSLAPIAQVLLDPQIEKVVHAGEQDLELLKAVAGRAPSPVFDTNTSKPSAATSCRSMACSTGG